MALEIINLLIVLQIFTLVNPLSSIPMLLMAYKNNADVKKIALKGVMLALIIAIAMVLTGPLLFNLFGISIDAFRIAGGIVLLLLGIDTIREKEEEEVQRSKPNDSIVALLATPMLTGPATISFLTLKTMELGAQYMIFNIILAFILVLLVFYPLAAMIPKINMTVISILSRILGLFLTAMAIEMIFAGLKAIIF
ncbi:MAG: MarC family protein [Candidatus Woesearchaeota archaeon]